MNDWKPGDVVLIDEKYVGIVWHDPMDAVNEPLSFVYTDEDGDPCSVFVHDRARRLAVIDHENREQVERLAGLMWSRGLLGTGVGGRCAPAVEVSEMQAALDQFANPKPAKPAEPMGLGAVVEDVDGKKWVRASDHENPWRNAHALYRRWSDMDAVRVLSEGVTE